MKRNFTILLTAALMLLSGLSWAQTTITWTASEQGYENQQTIESVAFDSNVTGSFNKGTNNNAPKYYTSGTAIRCYGGNYFTISSENDLTRISITFGSSDGSNAITTDCGSYENGTWTGTANTVTFTIGGTSGNRRIAGFTIIYASEAPSIATPTFSPAAGTYTEAQNVTISCKTENATIYYTTDGSTPDNTSTEYTGAISVAETTTIKAIAYVGESASNVASATYTILTPMTIAEVRAQGTGSVYTSGTVTSCVGTTGYIQDETAAICVFGSSLTIGDNITVQGSLTTYNGLLEITNPVVTVISSGNTIEPELMTIAEINSSTNQGWFIRIEEVTVTAISGQNTTVTQNGSTIVVRGITDVDYAVNDILSLDGNIGCYDVAQIANPQNVTVQTSGEPAILVEPTTVNVPCAAAEGTLTVTYQNIDEELGAEIYWYESDGTTAAEYDWVTAAFNNEGNVEYLIDANTGEARTAYMKVYALDDNAEDVYSNLVTINQAAYVAPIADGKYVKVSSTADLTSGQYLIVYEEGSLAFNGSLETLDAVGNTIEVILNNNEIAVTETTTASEFTINTTNGTIKSASGYYIGQTSDANGMASSIETAYTNTITITDGNADIVSSGAYLRYNSASNQTRFRYYKSSSYTGQKAIQLYKKVVEPETYTLDITGYGNSAGGYYLIATPVASVTPSAENGFLTDAYDLYEFDQSADNEWVNYETHFFNLVSGKGYLYANHDNTTLTFTGTPYNGNGEVELVYDENANLKGWNLIGNPFGVTATVDHDYYIMNENGDNFMLTSKETPIDAMQGIFIVTESADDNKAIFTTEEPETPGEKLVLNVSRNRGIVDRAMIRFGEGHQMPKAMLNENHTKLYIPQANNEYAVVRSDNESEMPINFKAAANGTYTISIDADNVEMDYLHLFDNMTGNDVDLLATPSYTFEANNSDYANRFKLVYKNTTSIEENGETFAYFNGENMIITNEGDAQLQVIDMTGRIVSTETLNGTATVKVNAAPGVYMLRLVNGNDIKTQKVIIK